MACQPRGSGYSTCPILKVSRRFGDKALSSLGQGYFHLMPCGALVRIDVVHEMPARHDSIQIWTHEALDSPRAGLIDSEESPLPYSPLPNSQHVLCPETTESTWLGYKFEYTSIGQWHANPEALGTRFTFSIMSIMTTLIKKAVLFLVPILIEVVIQVLRDAKYDRVRKRWQIENTQSSGMIKGEGR